MRERLRNMQKKKEDAKLFFEKAKNYHKHEEYPSAIEKYDQAIILDPKVAAYFYHRGIAKSAFGQYDKALSDFNQAIQLKPGNPNYFNQRGIAKARLGQYKKAIEDFDRAIQLKSDNADYFHYRGGAKNNLGQYDQAIEDYDRAIQLKSDNGDYFYHRGNAKYALNQYDKAIEDFDRAIQLKADKATYFNQRGNAKARLGQYDKALEDYDQAIHLKREDVFFLVNRGLLYLLLQKNTEADVDLQKAITLKTDNEGGYCQRGLAHIALQKWDKAKADFSEVLKLNVNTEHAIRALVCRAQAALELKEAKCATLDFQKAVKLRAVSAEQYYYRGQAFQALKEFDKALKDYDAALKLRFHYPEVYYQRALLREEQGDYQAALIDVQCALKQNPRYLRALELQKLLEQKNYILLERNPPAPQVLVVKQKLPTISPCSLQKIEKLGEGCFGMVSKGTWKKDALHEVPVAIKQLKNIAPSEKEKEKFWSEVAILAGLHCEYVVSFYGVVQENDDAQLVMELCVGGSLYAKLHSNDNISPEQKLKWGAQIITGVAYLHENHVIHHDLATRNVLLTTDGTAKITDFGLSKTKQYYANGQTAKSSVVVTGDLSFAWSAPEILKVVLNPIGAPEASYATDIYSLGVTLWEIVARKTPLAGFAGIKDINLKIAAIVNGYKDSIPQDAPKPYPEIIEKCREHDSDKRPTAKGLQQQYASLMIFGAAQQPRANTAHTTTTSTSTTSHSHSNTEPNLSPERRMGQ